jgi:hypothetical protein
MTLKMPPVIVSPMADASPPLTRVLGNPSVGQTSLSISLLPQDGGVFRLTIYHFGKNRWIVAIAKTFEAALTTLEKQI